MTDRHTVIREWDSWQKTETDFISSITSVFFLTAKQPDALIIEDLPARVPWMSTVKDVCRLQGRIVERMGGFEAVSRIVFVQPAQWRAHYGALLKNGTGAAAVVPVAARYDYLPPPLEYRAANAKERQTARKIATDYCAAYLIGRWAIDHHAEHHTFDAPRTSRYTRI